jgi:cell division septum initiation protein DivIVA
MQLITVLLAAIARKVNAVIAEYRKLVAEAKTTESRIVAVAEADTARVLGIAKAEEARLLSEARDIVVKARNEERAILSVVEIQTKNLYEEVADKLAKL